MELCLEGSFVQLNSGDDQLDIKFLDNGHLAYIIQIHNYR